MGIEITGHLLKIFEAVKVSERFTKREFVVEIADNPKYPAPVLFQLTGDRCSQLDDLRAGDKVRVDFSLRGREWKSPKGEVKYFNSLDAWTVDRDVPAPRDDRGGRRRDDDRDPDWVRRNDDRPPPRQGDGYGAPPRDDGDQY